MGGSTALRRDEQLATAGSLVSAGVGADVLILLRPAVRRQPAPSADVATAGGAQRVTGPPAADPALLPARVLKPLTTRYTPKENSKTATGIAPSNDQADSSS